MIELPLARLALISAAGALLCAGFSSSFAADAGAADAHPDFNGVWTWYIEPGSAPFGPPGGGPELPFTKAAKKKVDEYRALTGPTADNPGAHCLGTGMPGSMLGSGAYPMEIIQQPGRITIIYEAHSEIRRVFFGDDVIPEADRIPGRNGYSIGRWEGDTLIVETTQLREQVDQRYAHSDKAKIVERYRLGADDAGNKLLIAEMTMTDPVFYKKKVTDTKKWAFMPESFLLPYECDEEIWLNHLEELKVQAAQASAKPDGN